MRTCTWAPTVFQGTQIVHKAKGTSAPDKNPDVRAQLTALVQRYESMGFSDLLVAQRWWGSGTDIEGSSLDCLAMTAYFAAATSKINLITAIHPGFFQPSAIAKWGATIDQLSGSRWAINVTSGWNMQEFDMYGIDKLDHSQRYARSKEFIDVLLGCWSTPGFNFDGTYYQLEDMQLEPQPHSTLEVFQGGQSDAAIDMASTHSDWMFLNGGSIERISEVINKVRAKTAHTGREIKFALYAAPLCRPSDEEAWTEIDKRLAQIDHELLAQRHERLSKGAQGMWAGKDDLLSALDTNEGYASRLIGSPDTILMRIRAFKEVGISMLHLDPSDKLFNENILPRLINL